MTILKMNSGKPLHPEVEDLCRKYSDNGLDRRAFLRTMSWLGVSAASAAAFTGVTGGAARADDTKLPVAGGELRFGMTVQEITDPMLTSWTEASNLFRNSLEYLTYVDSENITHPYLAKSWTPSDDLRIWDFELDDRAKWSNGDAFTADDVVFNIARWIAPESQSSNKTAFSAIEKVEKTGEHSLRLTLSRGVVSLPEQLYAYNCPMLHRDFEKSGANWPANPVGTGPFALKTYEVSRQAVFEKRADYWGEPAYLDRIIYVDVGADVTTQLAALASDQIDVIFRAAITDVDIISKLPGVRLLRSEPAHTIVMRMKTDEKPFDDIRVRQAVQLAADNDQMLAIAYRGEGVVGGNYHVSPKHPDHFPLPPIARDVEKARALLADAGYPNGIDLELVLGNTQGKWEQDTAQVLQQNLAEAGIRLTLNVLPSTQYWPVWNKVPFGLTYWAHRPLGVMTLNLAYRSGGAWNESAFASPEFDAALDRAMTIIDPEERAAAMQEVQTILRDAAVIVQPFWPKEFSACTERVQDYDFHPSHYYRMDRVWVTS
ncbi:ABC transporter substrate-binding protein [Rhodobacter sp. 24-YEA-8]|uniref:ABC transporter substrate-binding protein n=1 Tax=Rhodobacter sp. 24-YEA-8 TaxID=1884310 RepID=UPI00089B71B9|nr:ABC transporter substrate-binding protein [Rhodobacter sp. 24-YEA-8]SEB84763.1 peptide/nickel transport system substrate-binding protein [Rhodobacter sp. 24-YEA-8]